MQKKVVLVAPGLVATFTEQDFRILQTEFDAILLPFRGPSAMGALWREISDADAVVIWFVGRHAVPAVLLAGAYGIPVVTIVGGYEAVWLPDIEYGIRPHSSQSLILRWILHRSARIVTISQTLQDGLLRRHADIAGKTRLVYNALETGCFIPPEDGSREAVLTVGRINRSTIEVKGLRLFWQTAAAFPEIPFVAVGPATDRTGRDFVSHCPPNLTWLGELKGDDLIRQYQKASVYFQGSVHESFSLAVAEAMSCGCIPVVSHNGALPEVVGDAGFYLEDLSVSSAVRAIREALNAPPERRHAARQRIVGNFDYERRRAALCSLVHEMIESTPARRG